MSQPKFRQKGNKGFLPLDELWVSRVRVETACRGSKVQGQRSKVGVKDIITRCQGRSPASFMLSKEGYDGT